jgi:hypothetical protein
MGTEEQKKRQQPANEIQEQVTGAETPVPESAPVEQEFEQPSAALVQDNPADLPDAGETLPEATADSAGTPGLEEAGSEPENARTETTVTTEVPEIASAGEDSETLEPAVEPVEETLPTAEPETVEAVESAPAEVAAMPEGMSAVRSDDHAPVPAVAGHEHAEEEEEHDEHHLDYSHHSKKQMVQVLESLLKENEFSQLGRILKEIRPPYDDLYHQEKEDALKKYVEAGGEADGFEYRGDELDQRFDTAYAALQERRREYLNSQEKHREENLHKKLDILERLREVVDAEETTASIGVLKKIQQEWRAIGPVAPKHIKTLWANYNALIDRFYDQRSIYFELKELDRKKNLELKLEICEKAEKLAGEENMKEAIRQLNELHEEFKNLGPVPMEEQEAIWQRFKAASDLIYTRRKDFYDHLKEQMRVNLLAKQVLIDKVQALSAFQSDRITEWNAKTAEVLQLQKDWESVGSIPRERARKVNRAFWTAFKAFFNNKGSFFKKLEDQRRENMRLKEELLARAEELRDSEEFERTSGELKDLQRRWKEIGPVPERYKDEIYNKFKQACDAFFNRRRERHDRAEHDQEENLSRKEALCAELEEMADGKPDLKRLKEIQIEWEQIGFVPRNAIKTIQMRYGNAVNRLADHMEVDDTERHRLKFKSQFSKTNFGPDAGRVIQKKEQTLRRQIARLENDINIWRTNMDYFAKSKTADLLKAEFNKKIEAASQELQELKEQLNLLTDI